MSDTIITDFLDCFDELSEWIPGARTWAGEILLGEIPLVDAGTMYELADAWGAVVARLVEAIEQVEGPSSVILEHWGGDGAAYEFGQYWQSYTTTLISVADSAASVQAAVQGFGVEVEMMKFMAALNLALLLAELIIMIITSPITLGGSLSGVGAAFAAARTAIVAAARRTISAIANLTVRGAVRGAVRLAVSTVPRLAVTGARNLGRGLLPRNMLARSMARQAAGRWARTMLRRRVLWQLERTAGREARRLYVRMVATQSRQLAREIEQQLATRFARRSATELAERAATRSLGRFAGSEALDQLSRQAMRDIAGNLGQATFARELAKYVGWRAGLGAGILGGGNLAFQAYQMAAGSRTEFNLAEAGMYGLQGGVFGLGMWGGLTGHVLGGGVAGGAFGIGMEIADDEPGIRWDRVGRAAAEGMIMGGFAGVQNSVHMVTAGRLGIGQDTTALPTERGPILLGVDRVAGTRLLAVDGGVAWARVGLDGTLERVGWVDRNGNAVVREAAAEPPDVDVDARHGPFADVIDVDVVDPPPPGTATAPPPRDSAPARLLPARPAEVTDQQPARVRAGEATVDPPASRPAVSHHPPPPPAEPTGGADPAPTTHQHALNSAGAEPGLDPTPETIRQGTVRMEEHPLFPEVERWLNDKGFHIKPVDAHHPYPEAVQRMVVQPDGTASVQREVYVQEGMRFLDLEHERDHVRQLDRFEPGSFATEVIQVRPSGSSTVDPHHPAAMRAYQAATMEYHVRLQEYIRLAENEVDPRVLADHADGVDHHRHEYERRLKRGHEREWARQFFGDIPELEARALELRQRMAAPGAEPGPISGGPIPASRPPMDGPSLAKQPVPGSQPDPPDPGEPTVVPVPETPIESPTALPGEVQTILNGLIGDLVRGRPVLAFDLPHRAVFHPETATLTIQYGDGRALDVSLHVNTELPPGQPMVVRPGMESQHGGWVPTTRASVALPAHLPAEPQHRQAAVADQLAGAWRALYWHTQPDGSGLGGHRSDNPVGTGTLHILGFDGGPDETTLTTLARALGGFGDQVAIRAPDAPETQIAPGVRLFGADPIPGVTGRLSALLRADGLPSDVDVIVGYNETAGIANVRRDVYPDARVVQVIDRPPWDGDIEHLRVLSRADLVVAVGAEVAHQVRALLDGFAAGQAPQVFELPDDPNRDPIGPELHRAITGLGDGVARVTDAAWRRELSVPDAVRDRASRSGAESTGGGRPRVLSPFIAWSSEGGGGATANRELAVSFRVAGAEVSSSVPSTPDAPLRVAAGDSAQVDVIDVGHVWGVLDDKGNPDRRAFMLLLANLPPDVDVVVGHSRFSGGAAQWLAEHAYPGARYVHILHSLPEQLDALRGTPEEGRAHARTERTLMSRADLVVGVGPLLSQEAARLNAEGATAGPGGSPAPVHTMIPDLPKTGDGPSPGPAGPRPVEVLIQGRADDRLKGVEFAARVVGMLGAQGIDIHLTVRGVPRGAMESETVRLSEIAGREVTIRPRTVDTDELLRDLQEADLVLMPSVHEGFGLVASEAARAGVPVLVGEGTGAGMFLGDPAYVPSSLGDAATVRDGITVAAVWDALRAGPDPSAAITALEDRRAGIWAQHIQDVVRDLGQHRQRAAELRIFLDARYATGNAGSELLRALGLEAPAVAREVPIGRGFDVEPPSDGDAHEMTTRSGHTGGNVPAGQTPVGQTPVGQAPVGPTPGDAHGDAPADERTSGDHSPDDSSAEGSNANTGDTESSGPPEWLANVREGNEFNHRREPFYTEQGGANEVHVEPRSDKGQFPRVDSYVPGKEIVSRKYTQLADVKIETALEYLYEFDRKYSEGTIIADTPTNRRDLGDDLIGKELEGEMILEVPVQEADVPPAILREAENLGITVRDDSGRIYELPDDDTS